MNNYRNATVSEARAVPVLLPCDRRKRDGFASFDEGFKGLRPVRVLEEAALDLFVTNGPKFFKEYGVIAHKDSTQVLGLLQLSRALKTHDQLEWNAACQHLATSTDQDIRLLTVGELIRQPGQVLARALSGGAARVRLVLWYKAGNELIPGLFCPDALAALYTLALVGRRGLGACVICGKPLVRERWTRKTCSSKCRQTLYRKHKPRRVQNPTKVKRQKRGRKPR
jgi:hypothetical protein